MKRNREIYSKIPDDSPVWNPITQKLVYESITSQIDFEDKSILDIGCGRADFLRHLIMCGFPFAFYTGIDLIEKFITQVPPISNTHFIVGDFMEEVLPEVDYVLALASLEIMEDTYANHEQVRFPLFFNKMWDSAKEGVIIALQSDYAPSHFRDDSWFAEPRHIINVVDCFTPTYYLDHTYAPHFFTMVALKGSTPWERRGGEGKNILGREVTK